MNIKLIRISCGGYKILDIFDLYLNDKMISITGENSTGKTTLLETIANKREFNDSINSDIRWHFEISNLTTTLGILKKIEVVMFKNKSDDRIYLEEIKGIEHIVKVISNQINKLEKHYNDILDKLKQNMLDIKKHFNQYLDSSIYLDYSKFKSFPRNRYEMIKDEINKIHKDDFIFTSLFDKKAFYYGFNLPEYTYDRDKFLFSNIERSKYDYFKRLYSGSTIARDGFEYDFDKVEKKYQEAVERHKTFELLIGNTFDDYEVSEGEINEFENELIDIKRKVNDIHDKLYTECYEFIKAIKLISDSNNGNYSSNIVLKEDRKNVLKYFNLDYLLNRKLSDMSSGERWFVNFATSLNSRNYSMLLLDEPAENLNPILQSKLVDYLHKEIQRGVPVIYSTHSIFMMGVNKRNDIYYLDRNTKSTLKKFEYADIDNLNKFQVENIMVHAARTILLVEGYTDKLLIEYALKFIDIDVLNEYIEVIDCSGHGIKPMIKLCIDLDIDFKAIMDSDKEKELKQYLKEKYADYLEYFHYFGEGDSGEIEDLFNSDDIKKLCCNSTGEFKMKPDKFDDLNQEFWDLSESLLETIRHAIAKLKML